MSKRAAQQAYAKSGVKPTDVQVVELHGKTFVSVFFVRKRTLTRKVRLIAFVENDKRIFFSKSFVIFKIVFRLTN